MRPDPYKQKRSRQHQARARAAGKTEGAAPAVSRPAPPQLPSNAGRYAEDVSPEDAAYDYASADELAQALAALQTRSPVGERTMAAGDCSDDALFSSALVEMVGSRLAAQGLTTGETHGLPAVGWLLVDHSIPNTQSPARDASLAARLRSVRVSVTEEASPGRVHEAASPDESWLDTVIQG